jgi:hypothetical protein
MADLIQFLSKNFWLLVGGLAYLLAGTYLMKNTQQFNLWTFAILVSFGTICNVLYYLYVWNNIGIVDVFIMSCNWQICVLIAYNLPIIFYGSPSVFTWDFFKKLIQLTLLIVLSLCFSIWVYYSK